MEHSRRVLVRVGYCFEIAVFTMCVVAMSTMAGFAFAQERYGAFLWGTVLVGANTFGLSLAITALVQHERKPR